jgi:predicted Zn-ribbon and HTH transcriptional regulator
VVPSGGRQRGDPADEWFVLTCTNCGWESDPTVVYPDWCPECEASAEYFEEETR